MIRTLASAFVLFELFGIAKHPGIIQHLGLPVQT